MAKGESAFGVGGYTHGAAYTDELAAEIVRRVATGEPLAVICRDEGMPNRHTVSDWRKVRPEFDEAMNEARDAGFDAIAADCMVIADDASGDYRAGEKGVLLDSDHISRSRLRVETRLKLLAKWDPRRYGEKVAIDHSGEIGKRELTDEELDAEIAKRLSAAP
jgi:hypothetical protein